VRACQRTEVVLQDCMDPALRQRIMEAQQVMTILQSTSGALATLCKPLFGFVSDFVHMHVYMFVCVFFCFVLVRVLVCTFSTCVHMCTYMCVHAHIILQVHLFTKSYVRACIQIYTCHKYMYIRACISNMYYVWPHMSRRRPGGHKRPCASACRPRWLPWRKNTRPRSKATQHLVYNKIVAWPARWPQRLRMHVPCCGDLQHHVRRLTWEEIRLIQVYLPAGGRPP
jgi:hypothetical protein